MIEIIGTRPTVIIGCAGAGLSLAVASIANNFEVLFVTYGALTGNQSLFTLRLGNGKWKWDNCKQLACYAIFYGETKIEFSLIVYVIVFPIKVCMFLFLFQVSLSRVLARQ